MNLEEPLAKLFESAVKGGATGIAADIAFLGFGKGLIDTSSGFFDQIKHDLLFWFGVLLMIFGSIDMARRVLYLPVRRNH